MALNDFPTIDTELGRRATFNVYLPCVPPRPTAPDGDDSYVVDWQDPSATPA